MNKSDKEINKRKQSYYDKINQAQFARKKDIEANDFLHFSLDDDFLDGLAVSASLISRCKELGTKPLLDFTGVQNTDLMIKYGTANITNIGIYEENLNKLRDVLFKIAETLFENEELDDATLILEELLRLKECRSKSYKLLYECYQKKGSRTKIENLKKEIKNGNSPIKEKILEDIF